MPRRRKHRHQIPETHRRKCEDTQSVKQVNHRHIEIPANWTSNKKEGFTFAQTETAEDGSIKLVLRRFN